METRLVINIQKENSGNFQGAPSDSSRGLLYTRHIHLPVLKLTFQKVPPESLNTQAIFKQVGIEYTCTNIPC